MILFLAVSMKEYLKVIQKKKENLSELISKQMMHRPFLLEETLVFYGVYGLHFPLEPVPTYCIV